MCVLGFLGAVFGVMMSFDKLKWGCPKCGRNGAVGGNEVDDLFLECSSCGVVFGSDTKQWATSQVFLELCMPSIAQLEKLLAAEPGDPFLWYGIAQEYAKEGSGGVEKALAAYDKCLSLDPLYCYAYFHKARCLADAGRVGEAVAVVQAGLNAAKQAKDSHAASELSGLLDEIS